MIIPKHKWFLTDYQRRLVRRGLRIILDSAKSGPDLSKARTPTNWASIRRQEHECARDVAEIKSLLQRK